MKQTLCFTILILLFSSCQSQQSKAMKDQQKAYEKLEEVAPGNIRTADGGWTMTCKMNSKVWKAIAMFPPEDAGRIIGYFGKESISLPYRRDRLNVGDKQTFSDHNAVDVLQSEGVAVWGGYEGGMTITKASDGWVEGTFNVTAHEGSKTLTISDGIFRIKVTK